MKICILYSGGLDSFLMYKWAKIYNPLDDIVCVYYKHGAESEAQEILRLPSFVDVRAVDWLGDKIKPQPKKSDPFAGAIYIPGRNMVFATLAASQELANEIWMGTLYDEDNSQATDKNEKFRSDTSSLLSYVLSPFVDSVNIRFPFVDAKMSKLQTVAWALENDVSKEELLSTTSCWHNVSGVPCGNCKQCAKRMLVFELNGIKEEFMVHPTESSQKDNMIAYVTKFRSTPDQLNADETVMTNMIFEYCKRNPDSNFSKEINKI